MTAMRLLMLLLAAHAAFKVLDVSAEEEEAIQCSNGNSARLDTAALTGISVSNISNTAVLAQWSLNKESEESPYQVSYGVNNGSLELETLTTASSSVVLIQLQSNAKYLLRVCVGSEGCCNRTFRTANDARANAVTNVRAHVYYPLRDNDSVITAQINWKFLDNVDSYRIFVNTTDGNGIEENPFVVKRPSGRIESISQTNNSLSFPLAVNRQYIIQVQGIALNGSQLPLSEPIGINTSSPRPAMELFTVNGMITGGVLLQPPLAAEPFINESVNAPFAVDKRNRRVFFTRSNVIRFLDNGSSKVLFNGTQANIEPLAMAYDWISQLLYVVANVNGNISILSIRYPDGRETIVHETEREASGNLRVSATVNPFTGYLHWSETSLAAGRNRGRIYRLDLKTTNTHPSELVVENSFSASISEDVTRNRLYYTNSSGVFWLSTVTSNINNTPVQRSFDRLDQISVDDNGFYVLRLDSFIDGRFRINYYQFNNNTATQLFDSTVGNNYVPVAIESTSPGTQPLPNNLQCLSPDVWSNETNRPQVIRADTNETSIRIEWSRPMVSNECRDILASVPFLEYRVYLTSNGQPVPDYNGTLVYDNYINITNITKGQQYSVSVSARNRFTIAPGNELLRGQPYILQNATDSTPSTTTSSLSSSRSTTPSHSPTPSYSPSLSSSLSRSSSYSTTESTTSSLIVIEGTPPTSGPLSNTVIVAAAGGAVALIAIIAVVIVTLSAVICIMKRKRSRSQDDLLNSSDRYNSSPPQRYVHPPAESIPPVTTVVAADPDYETAVLTPPTEPQPYAVPQDSLNEYRKNSAPSSLPSEYEVPLNAISENSQNVYSSLVSAPEQHLYQTTGPRPPLYTSLYPPTRDEGHIYTSSMVSVGGGSPVPPSPLTDEPSPYAEPVRLRSSIPPHSPTPNEGVAPKENPYFVLEQNEATPSEHTPASRLNSSDQYYQPGHVSVTSVPKENPYFVLEQQQSGATPSQELTPPQHHAPASRLDSSDRYYQPGHVSLGSTANKKEGNEDNHYFTLEQNSCCPESAVTANGSSSTLQHSTGDVAQQLYATVN